MSDTPTIDAIDTRIELYRTKFAAELPELRAAAATGNQLHYREVRRQYVADADFIGVAALSVLAHTPGAVETT